MGPLTSRMTKRLPSWVICGVWMISSTRWATDSLRFHPQSLMVNIPVDGLTFVDKKIRAFEQDRGKNVYINGGVSCRCLNILTPFGDVMRNYGMSPNSSGLGVRPRGLFGCFQEEPHLLQKTTRHNWGAPHQHNLIAIDGELQRQWHPQATQARYAKVRALFGETQSPELQDGDSWMECEGWAFLS